MKSLGVMTTHPDRLIQTVRKNNRLKHGSLLGLDLLSHPYPKRGKQRKKRRKHEYTEIFYFDSGTLILLNFIPLIKLFNP